MLTRGNFAKYIKHAYPTFYPFTKHGVLTNQGARRVIYHESTIYEAKYTSKKFAPIDFGEGINATSI